MSPLIPADVVRRFFELTGWTALEGGCWCRGVNSVRVDQSDGLPRLLSYRADEGLSEAQIGAKLALCAAAEYHLEEARLFDAARTALSESKAGDRAENSALTARVHARRFLDKAGINLPDWEASRRAVDR